MLTKNPGRDIEVYDNLPNEVRTILLAMSVLKHRIDSLPPADREDLFELWEEERREEDPEEKKNIQRAMEEILKQIPLKVKTLDFPPTELAGVGRSWAQHIGKTIRELRKKAKLTQEQLAKKAGIPQSHICRLERAEHTATNKTLEKLARALGVAVGSIDPCVE